MEIDSLYFLKNKDSVLINIIFHLLFAFLIIVVFTYSIIVLKVNVQNHEKDDLNKKIASFGLYQQKVSEKKVIDYKKKIDDFSTIIKDFKPASGIFAFIEQNSLSNVWFLNFDMSKTSGEVKLSGETENMEILSNQVKIFEKNKDYVNSINVLSSQIDSNGKIRFILSLSLNPKVYSFSK